jgi:hypothetical protein
MFGDFIGKFVGRSVFDDRIVAHRHGATMCLAPVCALATQLSGQGVSGTVCRPVDGQNEVRFGIFNEHRGGAGQMNPDLTALVLTAARAILVGEADRNPGDMVIGPVKGETQATFNMFTQTIGQFEAFGLDGDLHGSYPFG